MKIPIELNKKGDVIYKHIDENKLPLIYLRGQRRQGMSVLSHTLANYYKFIKEVKQWNQKIKL